jgi:hypothetical protein
MNSSDTSTRDGISPVRGDGDDDGKPGLTIASRMMAAHAYETDGGADLSAPL